MPSMTQLICISYQNTSSYCVEQADFINLLFLSFITLWFFVISLFNFFLLSLFFLFFSLYIQLQAWIFEHLSSLSQTLFSFIFLIKPWPAFKSSFTLFVFFSNIALCNWFLLIPLGSNELIAYVSLIPGFDMFCLSVHILFLSHLYMSNINNGNFLRLSWQSWHLHRLVYS